MSAEFQGDYFAFNIFSSRVLISFTEGELKSLNYIYRLFLRFIKILTHLSYFSAKQLFVQKLFPWGA